MSKLNPCGKDCPRCSTFCRKSCPEWQAAQEEKARIREIREKDLLVMGYLRDSSERKRRRAKSGHSKRCFGA